MDYNAPLLQPGTFDPDAGYLDENSPGGILGSVPPADAIEAPQREICWAIDNLLGDGTWRSAQDAGDLTQLYQAILAAAPITRTTTIINVAPGGSANPADPIAGDAFDKLSSAFAWLQGRRVMPGVLLRILIAEGVYTETADLLDLSHPDGLSITIEGADMLNAFPTIGNFADDADDDEAMLRARFAVKIDCLKDGIVAGQGGIRLIKNIALFGSGSYIGAHFGSTNSLNPNTFGRAGPAFGSVLNFATMGFATGIVARNAGACSGLNVLAVHNSGSGVVANNMSLFTANNIISSYNSDSGLTCIDGSFAEIGQSGNFDGNGAHGVNLIRSQAVVGGEVPGTFTARGNTSRGINADKWSRFDGRVMDLDMTGGGTFSAFANDGSQIFLDSASNLGSLSPANNTVGNNNSFIRSA
ncbi:hypothetical protein [Jiella marina]|uniref:hypothetical protein n=1 Tax=Jiella sp. LLJ827 TaxID=2917712 RepID=UPI002101C0B5|nr:hypothetical protein [Jiella sp. LLJ827]MCQ0986390.1 hypothetical protein [Jiella sp. LLJ827]